VWCRYAPDVLSCLSTIRRFSYGALAEGNYLIVNKNLIELFVLILLAFTQSGEFFGLDILRHRKKSRVVTSDPIISNDKIIHEKNSRRELIKAWQEYLFLPCSQVHISGIFPKPDQMWFQGDSYKS